MEKNNNSQNFLAVSILVAAILISGTIFYTSSSKNNQIVNQQTKNENNSNSQTDNVAVNLSEILKIKPEDAVLGNPNAPVTIIAYSDYECPFCEKFFRETEGLIKKDYIETGKVKMIYRDFPLTSHQYAMPAALAANCAKEQNKFWEYHNEIFKNQNNLVNFDFIGAAKKLGLNENKFKTCFESKKYENQIQNSIKEAISIGVNGTPTFFVNGQQVVGAQPYSNFKAIIERELNK
ncbi:MAG: DsbA family protein [Patescibacteria group bacterium]|nr:DsbA family protein [Patescibacteria group bacterium]MCX7589651.1 DsbA family protein [Patescibacteria group bacterium]MDW8279621.1 DsbA family protein [bacterium]